MFNPFFIFGILNIVILFLYNYKWSYLYPDIQLQTFVFTLVISIFSLTYGYLISRDSTVYSVTNYKKMKYKTQIIVLYCLYFLEMVVEGQVPFFSVLLGDSTYNYQEFGIPTLHIFLVTYTSFLALMIFNNYLITNKKNYIVLFLFVLLLPLLIYYRSMLVFLLVASSFMYLIKKRTSGGFNFNFKKSLLMVVIIIFSLYLFGLLGNMRINAQLGSNQSITNSEIILNVGNAPSFWYEHELLSPFYWSYLYITSPLANFQYNVELNSYSDTNIKGFISNEVIFDFLDPLYGQDKIETKLLTQSLNATSLFTGSFIYMGWLGPILMFIYIFSIFVIVSSIIPKTSVYYSVGVSIFGALLVLSLFRNMFNYTPFGFVLIYPILFHIISKVKVRNR